MAQPLIKEKWSSTKAGAGATLSGAPSESPKISVMKPLHCLLEKFFPRRFKQPAWKLIENAPSLPLRQIYDENPEQCLAIKITEFDEHQMPEKGYLLILAEDRDALSDALLALGRQDRSLINALEIGSTFGYSQRNLTPEGSDF